MATSVDGDEPTKDTLWRIPLDDSPPMILARAETLGSRLLFHQGEVLFVDRDVPPALTPGPVMPSVEGSIKLVPARGGASRVVVTGEAFPSGIAIVGGEVVWTHSGAHEWANGSIKSMPLPARQK